MRLIDADLFDAKYKEIKVRNGFAENEQISFKDISIFQLLALDELQTVDAIPVVRCKDCRWIERCGVSDDFFCADGKRKNGED